MAFADAAVATPAAALQLAVEASEAAPAAVQVLRCTVPLSEAEAAGWPEGFFSDLPLSRSKATQPAPAPAPAPEPEPAPENPNPNPIPIPIPIPIPNPNPTRRPSRPSRG